MHRDGARCDGLDRRGETAAAFGDAAHILKMRTNTKLSFDLVPTRRIRDKLYRFASRNGASTKIRRARSRATPRAPCGPGAGASRNRRNEERTGSETIVDAQCSVG